MPDFGKVGSLSNFYLGAQTIQRGKLLFRFSSRCANYSRERSNQGGILFKEIRYLKKSSTNYFLLKIFPDCFTYERLDYTQPRKKLKDYAKN